MSKYLFILFLTITTVAYTQTDGLRQKHFNVKKNLAIEGYDVVSYFFGEPKEGSEDFSFQYKGITYYFASISNLNKFKSSPDRYEPLYGGWCAYAMGAAGEKVKVDPETFKIVDGKLLLFYNFWGNNTLEDWNKNELKLKQLADKNWKKVVE